MQSAPPAPLALPACWESCPLAACGAPAARPPRRSPGPRTPPSASELPTRPVHTQPQARHPPSPCASFLFDEPENSCKKYSKRRHKQDAGSQHNLTQHTMIRFIIRMRKRYTKISKITDVWLQKHFKSEKPSSPLKWLCVQQRLQKAFLALSSWTRDGGAAVVARLLQCLLLRERDDVHVFFCESWVFVK